MQQSPRTVHLVYIVPRAPGLLHHLNKAAIKSGILPPLYRFGSDHWSFWPQPTFAPFSITRNLLAALRQKYKVRLYDWFETGICDMSPGDILLFHPKPDYSTPAIGNTLWQSFDQNAIGWKTLLQHPGCRSFVIIPYTHEDHNGWLKSIFEKSTGNLIAICGDYWTKDWSASPYSNDVKRLLQVNMCIDIASYPLVKHSFAPKGKRKFLYIGHTSYYKNTLQLEKIAERYPGFKGAHIGYGTIKGWTKLAEKVALTPGKMNELAQEYDIFVNCSSADAQATTVLEQMCFGMAVACTPQSGYSYPTITELHVSDTDFNCEQLHALQNADEDELKQKAIQNRKFAETFHSWKVFNEKIVNFIEH